MDFFGDKVSSNDFFVVDVFCKLKWFYAILQ